MGFRLFSPGPTRNRQFHPGRLQKIRFRCRQIALLSNKNSPISCSSAISAMFLLSLSPCCMPASETKTRPLPYSKNPTTLAMSNCLAFLPATTGPLRRSKTILVSSKSSKRSVRLNNRPDPGNSFTEAQTVSCELSSSDAGRLSLQQKGYAALSSPCPPLLASRETKKPRRTPRLS